VLSVLKGEKEELEMAEQLFQVAMTGSEGAEVWQVMEELQGLEVEEYAVDHAGELAGDSARSGVVSFRGLERRVLGVWEPGLSLPAFEPESQVPSISPVSEPLGPFDLLAHLLHPPSGE